MRERERENDIGVSGFRTSAPVRWRWRRQDGNRIGARGPFKRLYHVLYMCIICGGGTRPFSRSLLYFIIYLYCCCYRFVCFCGGGVRIAACGILYIHMYAIGFSIYKKTPTLVPHNLYVYVYETRKVTRVFVYVRPLREFGGIPSQSLLLSGRSDFLGVELALSLPRTP